jgi:GTP cyclohydrolase II
MFSTQLFTGQGMSMAAYLSAQASSNLTETVLLKIFTQANRTMSFCSSILIDLNFTEVVALVTEPGDAQTLANSFLTVANGTCG